MIYAIAIVIVWNDYSSTSYSIDNQSLSIKQITISFRSNKIEHTIRMCDVSYYIIYNR